MRSTSTNFQIIFCFYASLLVWLLLAQKVFSETTPTLDLSKGHEFSLFAQGKIRVTEPNSRTSQSILDKKLKVILGEGRVFTVDSDRGAGLFWCAPGSQNIEWLHLTNRFLTLNELKKKMNELRHAFGWENDDFDKWINQKDRLIQWIQANDKEPPYWMISVGS